MSRTIEVEKKNKRKNVFAFNSFLSFLLLSAISIDQTHCTHEACVGQTEFKMDPNEWWFFFFCKYVNWWVLSSQSHIHFMQNYDYGSQSPSVKLTLARLLITETNCWLIFDFFFSAHYYQNESQYFGDVLVLMRAKTTNEIENHFVRFECIFNCRMDRIDVRWTTKFSNGHQFFCFCLLFDHFNYGANHISHAFNILLVHFLFTFCFTFHCIIK